MSNHSQQIVQKLWSYGNVLRDEGLSHGDLRRARHLPALPQDGANERAQEQFETIQTELTEA